MKRLALAVIMLATPADADDKASWYAQCKQGSEACYMYLRGIHDTLRKVAGPSGTRLYCAPEGFNFDEFKPSGLATHMVRMIDTLDNEPVDNPLKPLSFSGLVIAALESGYPRKP